ncbi:type VI secretion system ATPase TssH [Methylobacterium sp. Leaf102]|uniref:type VI secretion system ATPase TssH n=1 Tax=Methylobacterium sp. Leaf102 TaxID=1736253 RepID=UPI0009E96844|nr:type VI secretion system ATPase TssH [Methylobacterium sp. Leaf102]
MPTFDLHVVVARLDPPLRQALEKAVGLAVAREHGAVEVEHWLLALVDGCRPFTDLLSELDCRTASVSNEVAHALDRMRRSGGGAPSLSQATIGWIEEAWLTASLRYGRDTVTAADLVSALTTSTALRATVRDIAPSLRVDPGRVADMAAAVPASVRESGGAPVDGRSPEDAEIERYTVDLTAEARAGRIDPVIGRVPELRQVIDILLRRRQNNPILTGEAGVGKTAIVEALALQIAAGAVPAPLADVCIRALDLGLLQAGAGVKGEFERRLTAVIAACKAAPTPVILFIDEAHTLIGAGNQAGGSDAANLLKPALARGEVRSIAATTWSEYKRHIERDPALTRRFQVVKVDEPVEETAARMLRGLVPVLEAHHGVTIRDAAIVEAVRLSARYLPARQLPDKAVSVLDTAAAAVAISRSSDPATLQDLVAEARYLETERTSRARDGDKVDGAKGDGTGGPGSSGELDGRIAAVEERLAAVRDRLGRERELIAAIEALEAPGEIARPGVSERHAALTADLAALQGDAPLVHREVDREAVAAVIARWTGIPAGRLLRDAALASQSLEERLKRRVTGQDAALATIAAATRTATAGLADPRKPPGVFLMVGTSGVGKTETALALAEALHGGEASLTVVNMSEFKEEHKVSSLIGAPPGYVGYGEGGVLTEAVRRRPYGILLLDEVEKAHPSVQDVFYQVFDKGSLRDGEGRDVDFRNTTVILTANAGSETLAALAADPETMPEGEALVEAIRPELLRHFKPAFLGRVTIVPYRPLTPEILARIARLQLERVRERAAASHGTRLVWDDGVEARIVARCLAADIGARAIEGTLTREILPALSDLILEHALDGRVPREIALGVASHGQFTASADGAPAATAGAATPLVAPSHGRPL